MIYKTIDEYLDANMKDAYEIANKLDEDDKEELILTLNWLKAKVKADSKFIKWQEDATKEIVTEEQYKSITNLFMVYMHNDIVLNTPIGQELFKMGSIGFASIPFEWGNNDG